MGPLTRSGNLRAVRFFTLVFHATLLPQFINAQTPVAGRCTVTAVPTQVRAEGLTERMGDIVVQCTGSIPGAVLSGNLSVFLPVSITNRLDANSTNLTHEAVLSADLGSGFVPTGIGGQITNQVLAFNGVNLTVPPSGNLSLKISNIRAAPYILGTLAPQPVLAQLSFSSPASIQINQSQLVVAYPQIGLTATLYDRGITCTGSPLPSTTTLSNLFNAGTAFASARATEGFAAAFQPRTPGEDNGTRLLVKYSQFPAGARLFVPNAVAGSNALAPSLAGDLGGKPQIGQYVPGSGSLLLIRVLNTDANGAGGFLAQQVPAGDAIALNGVGEVTMTNGSGIVVYEVVDANPAAQETVQFPTFFGIPANTPPAVAQESISLAPVSTVLTASQTAPIPRFAALPPPSDCNLLGDCGASYFPKLSVLTPSVIQLTAVAGGEQTGLAGYIPVNNAGGGIMNWTASVVYQNGSGWLKLSSTSGQNYASIFATATGAGLSAGTYRANVTIDAGPLAGTFTVPVVLTVTPAPAATAVVVSKVVNAATFDATPLVAGSLGTIMGSHLSGKNVSAMFDSSPATLLYQSDSQINLQIPAELGAKTTANLVVTVDGVSSAPRTVTLAPAWPSVFANGILNQDNSVNSAKAGAAPGSVLQIFATGIPAGAIVSARIADRKDLIPLYAGAAPTVPGVQQVNVAVPADLTAAETQLTVCAVTGGQEFCSAGTPLIVQ